MNLKNSERVNDEQMKIILIQNIIFQLSDYLFNNWISIPLDNLRNNLFFFVVTKIFGIIFQFFQQSFMIALLNKSCN